MEAGKGDSTSSKASVRTTITLREAAVRLGVTSSWVHRLLDDPGKPLSGSPRSGKGHPRSVYEDTLAAQLQKRRRPGRTSTRGVSASEVEELRWAVRQLNAVNDALHAAAAKEAAAFRLHRDALNRMTEAFELQVQATTDVRRADALRSEVLGVVVSPDDPADLAQG